MRAFDNTVTIARPAGEVFAFLADFQNVPRWNYAIEQTRKLSPGPVGVGTAYRQTRTTLSNFSFVIILQPLNKTIGVHFLRGPAHTLFGNVLAAKTNISLDRAAEEKHFLKHDCEVLAQRVQIPVA